MSPPVTTRVEALERLAWISGTPEMQYAMAYWRDEEASDWERVMVGEWFDLLCLIGTCGEPDCEHKLPQATDAA